MKNFFHFLNFFQEMIFYTDGGFSKLLVDHQKNNLLCLVKWRKIIRIYL